MFNEGFVSSTGATQDRDPGRGRACGWPVWSRTAVPHEPEALGTGRRC